MLRLGLQNLTESQIPFVFLNAWMSECCFLGFGHSCCLSVPGHANVPDISAGRQHVK